ncbi:MAG: asparagine synthase, partial [Betaproteobacteria bacterium]
GQLHFAARADSLIDASAELDPQAIFDYLYFHCIPSPRTIFKGVKRLAPGHYATFENGTLSVAPYWVPKFEPPAEASFAALRGEFRALLEQAVRRQLDSAKPACFLSGGTDSSTVAGMIGRVSGQPAATYSIGFEAAGYDEMAYARIAARHFGTEHHEYYVTPEDLVRSIGDVAGSYDQPFGNSSVLPAYYCAKMAHEDGVHKLLAGDGGDELFGGNSRYAMQRIFSWYQHVPPLVRGAVMEPLLRRAPLRRIPLLRKAAGYVEQARVPMPDRLQMYNLLRRIGMNTVLSPAFMAQVDPDDVLRQQREVWTHSDASSQIDRTLAFDWRYTLAESDLPKVRGATQLAGVEVGFPFLDRPLLEFSMRLPAEYKLKGLKLRWFFKEALRGFLPDEILSKKKHGFGLPFGVWVGRHPALNRLAVDSLASLSTRGIVRPEFIKTLVADLLPSHPGYYGEMVWILMMLEQWMQRHTPSFKISS